MVRAVLVVGALAGEAIAQAPGDVAPGDMAPGDVAPGDVAPAPAPVAAPPPPYPPAGSYAPTARERSDRGLVALGGVLGGGGPSDWFYGAWLVEGAVTIIPGRTLGVRARGFLVLAGGTVESDWSGDFSRIGAGLEARTCTAGLGSCLFVDLDLGYQGLTLDDHTGDFVRSDKGVLVGPRFGVDLGGALRVRFALETYRMFASHVDARTSDARAFGTVGLSLALGYQL